MTDTSPAPSPAPAAPTPSSPQMTAADSETAPLLSQDPAAPADATTSDADQEANVPPNGSGPPPPKKHILILTYLSLALSVISLSFIAATYILIAALPFYIHLNWSIVNSVHVVVPITILAILLSFSNLVRLRRQKILLPLIVNIVADIIIVVYNIAASIEALNFLTPGYCTYPTDEGECNWRGWQLVILMGIAMAVALGVGIVHLVLFILRCIEAYRTRFWRPEHRPSTWWFPTGTFTVELTIKLLRQEREGQIRI